METTRANRLVLVPRETERLPGGSRMRRYGLARLERLERMEHVAEISPVEAARPPAAAPDPGR